MWLVQSQYGGVFHVAGRVCPRLILCYPDVLVRLAFSIGMGRNIPDREPRIYDVAELPKTEQNAECPLYLGDGPELCENPAEYVFVYEASLDPKDKSRRNCLCCAECKPQISAPIL